MYIFYLFRIGIDVTLCLFRTQEHTKGDYQRAMLSLCAGDDDQGPNKGSEDGGSEGDESTYL